MNEDDAGRRVLRRDARDEEGKWMGGGRQLVDGFVII